MNEVFVDSLKYRITFTELIQRWTAAHTFHKCFSCIFDDLMQLEINGIQLLPTIISAASSTCDTLRYKGLCEINFGRCINTLGYLCKAKLKKDSKWPIPMQCCILAAVMLNAAENMCDDYDPEQSIVERAGVQQLARIILSIYDKHFTKWDYPRLYTMFLLNTMDANDLLNSFEIAKECVDLIRYRLKLSNHNRYKRTKLKISLFLPFFDLICEKMYSKNNRFITISNSFHKFLTVLICKK